MSDDQMEKAALEAIRLGFNRVGIAQCMDVPGLSDRRADRVLQRLRRQGKIEYSGGQWRAVVPMEICAVEKPRR